MRLPAKIKCFIAEEDKVYFMKRTVGLLCMAMMWYSCKPGVPKDLIQPDKMEKVLVDIHVVDGYLASISDVDSAKKIAAQYYKGVYKKYSIDSVLYNRSLDYYYKNPEVFSKIYEGVTNNLSRQKLKLNRSDSIERVKQLKKEKVKFKADSIKRIDSIKKAALPKPSEKKIIVP